MKPNRIFFLALAAVMTFSGGLAADKPSVPFSEEELQSLVVSAPDSLLGLLDKIEDGGKRGRPALPRYRIDRLRALAYNEKRMFPIAERYAGRVLCADSVSKHPDIRLNMLTLIANARTVSGNFSGSINAARLGVDLARSLGDLAAECNLLTTMAKVAFAMGDRQGGYEYIDRVVNLGKKARSARELANVSAAYGVKIVELYADDRFEDAISESQKRLAVIRRIDETGGAPDGFTDQQRAYAFARIASSAQKAGKLVDAARAYESFCATDYGNTAVGRAYIMDYLLESRQWHKALEFSAALYPVISRSDTISGDFRDLLICDSKARSGLGDWRAAYSLMERAGVIQDSLYNREKQDNARELAAIFALNEKDKELSNLKIESERRHMYLLIIAAIALTVVIILAVVYRLYRNSCRHNRIVSRQIDELTAQRSIIHSLEKEREDRNYNVFVEIERGLLESKKYLEPDYGRDSLFADFPNVSRSKISQLIQNYTGLTVSDYINKLRVEYSVSLIRMHPEWTIDAIADASGYPRKATYYSNFNKVYGLTPAQYRRQYEKTGDL